jgi:hypothetical protein
MTLAIDPDFAPFELSQLHRYIGGGLLLDVQMNERCLDRPRAGRDRTLEALAIPYSLGKPEPSLTPNCTGYLFYQVFLGWPLWIVFGNEPVENLAVFLFVLPG